MITFAYEDDKAILTGEEITPEVVFECGQTFRFNPTDDGYTGIAKSKVLNVKKNAAGGLELFPVEKGDIEDIWLDYFDCKLDYEKLKEQFKSDSYLLKAMEAFPGMRLLNQDPYETIISFIISQNNNIKRIKGIIERICALAGDEILYNAEIYHAFPTPTALARLTEDDYRSCGAGYRAPYLLKTARKLADYDLSVFYKLDYIEAKQKLMEFEGIGPKVADCILLFAFDKKCAFPKDVWVKRVLNKLYNFESSSDQALMDFAYEKFGEYSGVAQQFLFHYARMYKIL